MSGISLRVGLATFLMTSIWLPAVQAQQRALPERLGCYVVLETRSGPPAGTVEISIPAADFEASDRPPSWPAGGEVVTADDAPQGRRYTRIPAGKGGVLMTPWLRIEPGRPHLLSFWLRSPVAEWAAVEFNADLRLRTFGDHYPGVPATDGRWRHLAYFVLAPADARTIRLQIQPMQGGHAGEFIAVDDLRLRTATWEEMSAAYAAERAVLPYYDDSPVPGAGQNLALSIAKWQGRGVPGKPFLIWAIGSSWTNFQGDGYPLLRAIRERFPKAPELVYRKHAGSGTPWDYVRGWVEQFVAADEPDLILTYTNGSPEGLDALLGSIRSRSTADVIVPSLHFFENSTLSDEDVERGVVDWEAIRTICRKHRAEFIDNRRELASYLRRQAMSPRDLLVDAVHQNRHGVIRIWDNIVRHIAPPAQESVGLPDGRERIIRAATASPGGSDGVVLSEGWTRAGGAVRTRSSEARIEVRFTGSQLTLIGLTAADGGTARVRVDGQEPDACAAFAMDFILPRPGPGPPVLNGPGPGDVAPHAVVLRAGIVPQEWSIVMTSDAGDYRLEGAVTGPDGVGNNVRPFVSRSAQIAINPALWRHNTSLLPGGKVVYGNRAGDRFQFHVLRTVAPAVHVRGAERRVFSVPLVRNLTPGPHRVELIACGDGDVIIDGFHIARPLMEP